MPIHAIQRGIEHGVRKVNIDTDGRLAITTFVREHLNDKPGDWDPRGVGKAARAGQKLICMQRMQELGMAGHAGDYTADVARRDGRALRRRRALHGLRARALRRPPGQIA